MSVQQGRDLDMNPAPRGLKAASQDRPWVLVIREVGMACTRMCTIHRTADEAKKAAEQWEGPPPRE